MRYSILTKLCIGQVCGEEEGPSEAKAVTNVVSVVVNNIRHRENIWIVKHTFQFCRGMDDEIKDQILFVK